LWNNSDIDTNYIYVEIMYERVKCEDFAASFSMEYGHSGSRETIEPVQVDSVLNNDSTFTFNKGNGTTIFDSTYIMRPLAGGYKLRFKKPVGVTADDSATICVKSHRMPFLCEGCAAAGSDALFAKEQDVNPACPYPGLNVVDGEYQDLIACHQRPSKALNWEAWMVDERDCKPYRIVQMPDTLWWLAQNLNYTKGLKDAVRADSGGSTGDGYYWCIGAASLDSTAKGKPYTVTGNLNPSVISGGDTACRTYGALYTWLTIIRADGIFDTTGVSKVVSTAHSTLRGICPKNWLLPTNRDWYVMFNAVEGCEEYGTGTGRYCSTTYTGMHPGPTHFAKLANTIAGHKNNYILYPTTDYQSDTIAATKTYPAWSWHSKDLKNPEYKKNFHNIPHSDYYGFSILPAGDRYEKGFRLLGKGNSLMTGINNRLYLQNAYWQAGIGGILLNASGSVRCLRDVTKP
jgi:uncharacterized protein (TIGR02145 family)